MTQRLKGRGEGREGRGGGRRGRGALGAQRPPPSQCLWRRQTQTPPSLRGKAHFPPLLPLLLSSLLLTNTPRNGGGKKDA